MKILVVAAHPDDEILGVGGTICKHVDSGDKVEVCIVTKAYEPEWSKDYMDKKMFAVQNLDIKAMEYLKKESFVAFNLDRCIIKYCDIKKYKLSNPEWFI